jgi:hypothetical protein
VEGGEGREEGAGRARWKPKEMIELRGEAVDLAGDNVHASGDGTQLR